MRNFGFGLALVLSLAGGCLFCSCDKPDRRVTDKPLVILFDNDVHCGNDAYGYAQAVGLKKAINASDTAYCALVSSGDYIQGGTIGSESKGADMISILNLAAYDAVAVGNHEFDFGMERLQELLARLTVPVTCVNLTKAGSSKPMLDRYVMMNIGAKKVAAVGVLTPFAMTAESFAFFDAEGNQIYDLNQSDIISMVQDAVNDSRKKGADYVIVLSHLGEADYEVTSVDLIAGTQGIDVVLDGHSHSVIPCRMVKNANGVEVPLAQTGTKFANLGKLYFDKDGKVDVSLLPVDSIEYSDGEVAALVDSLKAVVDEKFGQVVGHSDYLLTINDGEGNRAVRRAETNLGDFVADAYRVVTGAQIGIENGGCIRVDVPSGDITRKMLLEAVPFGKGVMTASFSGEDFAVLLNVFVQGADGTKELGAFAQVSGIRYRIHAGEEPCVTCEDIEVFDSETLTYVPMKADGVYVVALTDFAFDLVSEKGCRGKIVGQGYGDEYEIVLKYFVENLGGVVPSQYAQPQGRIVYVN